jgi:hypothetical protein
LIEIDQSRSGDHPHIDVRICGGEPWEARQKPHRCEAWEHGDRYALRLRRAAKTCNGRLQLPKRFEHLGGKLDGERIDAQATTLARDQSSA